jgi:hypothetical protein
MRSEEASFLVIVHLDVVIHGFALALLARENALMDVWYNTRFGEVTVLAEQFVEFRVVLDPEHDMSRNDPLSLGQLALVACELKDLRADVLECRGEVDRSTTTDSISIATLFHEACDAGHCKLKTSSCTLASTSTLLLFERLGVDWDHDVVLGRSLALTFASLLLRGSDREGFGDHRVLLA